MKQINNKVLVIGLAVLIAIFVLSRLFRTPHLESNFRKELVSVDTASVTEVRIEAPAAELIKVIKEGNSWKVSQGAETFAADPSIMSGLLASLKLNAQRMASRKKEKWEEFKVDDKGTHISVFSGSDKEADFWVGKIGIDDSKAGANPYGGNAGYAPYTYIRLSDENETYVVDGFLEPSFNRKLTDLRDRTFLRIPKDLITKVTFTYPADSSFVLEKRDTVWYAAGKPAAKANVENYLRILARKNMNSFADDGALQGQPAYKIQIDGTGGGLGTVEVWKTDSDWILKSSRQPNVFFKGSDPSGDKELMVNAAKFLN